MMVRAPVEVEHCRYWSFLWFCKRLWIDKTKVSCIFTDNEATKPMCFPCPLFISILFFSYNFICSDMADEWFDLPPRGGSSPRTGEFQGSLGQLHSEELNPVIICGIQCSAECRLWVGVTSFLAINNGFSWHWYCPLIHAPRPATCELVLSLLCD